MPDYREMYLTLFRAVEQAVDILIEAQRTCEEIYLSQEEPALVILSEQQAATSEDTTIEPGCP